MTTPEQMVTILAAILSELASPNGPTENQDVVVHDAWTEGDEVFVIYSAPWFDGKLGYRQHIGGWDEDEVAADIAHFSIAEPLGRLALVLDQPDDQGVAWWGVDTIDRLTAVSDQSWSRRRASESTTSARPSTEGAARWPGQPRSRRMHIYDLLGLRGGNPRFQTLGWTLLLLLLFGALTVFGAVLAVQAAEDERWWPVAGWLLSSMVCGVIFSFAVSEWRRLRSG